MRRSDTFPFAAFYNVFGTDAAAAVQAESINALRICSQNGLTLYDSKQLIVPRWMIDAIRPTNADTTGFAYCCYRRYQDVTWYLFEVLTKCICYEWERCTACCLHYIIIHKRNSTVHHHGISRVWKLLQCSSDSSCWTRVSTLKIKNNHTYIRGRRCWDISFIPAEIIPIR